MRNVLLFLLAFLLSLRVGAVPAKRQRITLTLADGSKLPTTFFGDENFHFYATGDGRAFLLNEKREVREVNAQTLRSLWRERLRERNEHRQKRSDARDRAAVNPVSGNKRGLVILVNFSDRKMIYEPAEYQDFFNKEGYSGFGMCGSVHDYFYAQSYGVFNLTFDVVGPVTVSKGYAYYGKNAEGEEGRDLHPAEMVIEAINLADSLVNYSDYDWDGDGYVDQVFVMYAGYNEAQDAEQTSLIWPHEWTLSSASWCGDGNGRQRKDGVIINTYACSSELRDSVGTDLDGIGTACHEFSHCLGLPDMYDTDKTDGIGFGMDMWSLMDAGSYGGKDYDGTTPTGYTSYERMFCGWLAPEKLTDPCMIRDMAALSEEPKAYILYNDGYRNEYYLLENRQNTGWDTYLPGHGMLVLHVDYDSYAWDNNAVNDVNSHPRLTIIPADNQFQTEKYPTISDLAGDPYPGTSGNTALTDYTTPAALLYHNNMMGQKSMGRPITDITENNGRISFTFDGGFLVGIPEALEPEDVTDTGFTAKWTQVEDADFYQISLSGKVFETAGQSYVFTGLEPNATYYYKVRAMMSDIVGEWSNTVSVELSDITRIKDVNAYTACPIFDLQGRQVTCPGKGIYILNGRKMVISF
ncbi:MAG: M6 family metalloprotease domain-containing protein [Bacteroidaceae bacterium]|nr:M6 family metalloprotease domain-containing protein [Bacteroidaceae bacterium]